MINKKFLASVAITVGLFSNLSAAVIVSFDTANVLLGGWQNTSPPAQGPNQVAEASRPTAVVQSTEYVTQGDYSGQFQATWLIPSEHTNNPYSGAGFTAPVWGIRYNLGSPTALPGNSFSTATGLIEMDVHNPNSYVVHVAIYCETPTSTQLERGQFLAIPPNTSAVYSWDMAQTAPVGWITGNGSWDSPTARIKGLIVAVDSVSPPDNTEFKLFVDNIRDSNSQSDTVAPASPKVLSAKQHTVPGEVMLTWEANTDSDLAKYNIYLAEQSAFGTPNENRIVFPATPLKSVNPPATSTNVPVQTDTIQYIMIKAEDNATPIPNESERSMVLAVRLKADGSAVSNHIILDYDRFAPGDGSYVLEGYAHGVAYSAEALAGLSEYFDSASSKAVDNNSFVLTPSGNGVTIWSNILDGNGAGSVALSDESVAKLTDYTAAYGNLLISGAGLAEDLSTRGPAQEAFLQNVLKASLASPNSGVGIINATGTLFPKFTGEYRTTFNVYDYRVAVSTTSNEVYQPLDTAVGDGVYVGDTNLEFPVIASDNKVVLLGFPFEALGRTDTAGSIAARQDLMEDILTYLRNTSDVADWNLY